jgi:hypothetical protein
MLGKESIYIFLYLLIRFLDSACLKTMSFMYLSYDHQL